MGALARNLEASGPCRRLDKGCIVGFQTPLYELSDYLGWTASGKIQLPDFQRGYKWDDERIRALLVTILRGHPLGVVMLLKTGNDAIRFKPRPVEGVTIAKAIEPDLLLLDGQQRLTSLTQALTGNGVVATKDARGKLLERKYYVHIPTALKGEDYIEDAVLSLPSDGIERSNFGRDVVRDVSTPDLERAADVFPVSLLFGDYVSWLFDYDKGLAKDFHLRVIKATSTYNIPAIELDTATSKSAVATVFEKVNTGGLGLNVFELLTATFAGDRAHFERHGHDFRLNDDWQSLHKEFAAHGALASIKNTDFLQGITILTTRARNRESCDAFPPAVSAKRDDILKLGLDDYLRWRDPLRDAFVWVATFLADRCIYDDRFVPYATQLVPLAVIRTVMGKDADLVGVQNRLIQWFWCGILGELYGSAVETQFVRDVEQVPDWAHGGETLPHAVATASFRESRLLSLRTRNAAAYKGIYALMLGRGARDWMNNQALDKAQYAALAVDIHHIFPQAWCEREQIDPGLRESIVNKTPLSANTNRTIGGVSPSRYLQAIEHRASITGEQLDAFVATHLIAPSTLRADDFDAHFAYRKAAIIDLIESAMRKPVQRDLDAADAETPEAFDPEDAAVMPDLDDQTVDDGSG